MRLRTVLGTVALGAALALGTTAATAATAQAAPAASSGTEATSAAADQVFIGYYSSSTACHIAGTSMAGDDYTCIRKGTRWALYIFV
ncbi:hypothetical protein AB0A69_20090 [Streptomyces sp. NPDC045431]|uniref:hypothetical protein n=1 Tax=Streptomyces sp. NPDC045431 TaxID=3155613 RepID=UPI0033DF8A8D